MPINYGTIGTGWITTSWILAAQATSQWKLGAIYSRSEESATAFAKKHNCTKTHTSLDDLAADSSLQAIYVASPNALHHGHAKQMLQAGKHVILEKPATSTVSEWDELVSLAKAQGVFLIEAYRHIQEANYKTLQRVVSEEAKLGEVYGASFTYASYSSRYNNVLAGEEPNIFSLKFGGGSLVDIGVYPVTFAVGLFGKPRAQQYVPYICRTGVDGGGVIILQYEGFGVQINNSKSYTSTAPCEIYGERGTLTINGTTDLKTLSLLDSRSKQTSELADSECLEVEKPNVNMQEEAEEFARIINHRDVEAAKKLEEISKIVLEVTQDLRRQNGILYPADKQ